MTKNPFINAFAALVYIVLIVSLMNYFMKSPDKPDTMIIPIMMLSLFTLSAAVMGYLFVLQPVSLYLDGQKQAGIKLFVQTVGVFAVITALTVVVFVTGVF